MSLPKSQSFLLFFFCQTNVCLAYTSVKATVTVLYVGSSKREKTDCVRETRQVKRDFA